MLRIKLQHRETGKMCDALFVTDLNAIELVDFLGKDIIRTSRYYTSMATFICPISGEKALKVCQYIVKDDCGYRVYEPYMVDILYKVWQPTNDESNIKTMITKEFKFSNGDEVVEKITGFKGVIIGTAFGITGCNQHLVTAKPKDEFSEPIAIWYDEGLLSLVSKEKFQ